MSPVRDQPFSISPDAPANHYRQSAPELCRRGSVAGISRAERRAVRLSRRNYREADPGGGARRNSRCRRAGGTEAVRPMRRCAPRWCCSTTAGAEAIGGGRVVSTRKSHEIWIEQCDAAEEIEFRYGLKAAFDYLVTEKLLNFASAAADHREFARELPRFVSRVRGIFTPQQIRTHLARI